VFCVCDVVRSGCQAALFQAKFMFPSSKFDNKVWGSNLPRRVDTYLPDLTVSHSIIHLQSVTAPAKSAGAEDALRTFSKSDSGGLVPQYDANPCKSVCLGVSRSITAQGPINSHCRICGRLTVSVHRCALLDCFPIWGPQTGCLDLPLIRTLASSEMWCQWSLAEIYRSF
jgi:hypothetical protein